MEWIRYISALLFVLGLIGGCAFLLRRYGIGGGFTRQRKGRPFRRLRIVENLSLDPRRRVVLIEKDTTEYLLLLGPNRDLQIVDGGCYSASEAEGFLDEDDPDHSDEEFEAGFGRNLAGKLDKTFSDILNNTEKTEDSPSKEAKPAKTRRSDPSGEDSP